MTKRHPAVKQLSRKLNESEITAKAKELIEMRTFNTGATRDTEEGKLDFEGFLSPLTLHRYAEYMHRHRKQSDGKMRDSDNWQKGIPIATYMKSMWRHFMDAWTLHRANIQCPEIKSASHHDRTEALCAIIFNASGYLHELLKEKETEKQVHCPNDPCNPCGKNWLGLTGKPSPGEMISGGDVL